jgi:23S rRNA-/tRNA-specific pseudouridylate synthase
VDAKLRRHPVTLDLFHVDQKQGKKAKTLFEVVERFSGYTLLKCQPLAGWTHHIRVHLRHAGYPVVGDALYGGQPLLLSKLKSEYRLKAGREERPLIGRVAIHAEQLIFAHPATGTSTTISAPWPKDLTVAVKYLRRYAAGGVSDAPPAT